MMLQRHQFLAQKLDANVSWLLYWQTSHTLYMPSKTSKSRQGLVTYGLVRTWHSSSFKLNFCKFYFGEIILFDKDYCAECTCIFSARKRNLGQGNISTPVCHSVHRGGHVWLLPGGAWGVACMVLLVGVRGFIWGGVWFYSGVCVVLFGGDMCGFIWGTCVVLFVGGMHGFIQGGIHGFIWRGMCGFFSFFGYNDIRSMSGRYASYWNAFLLR